MKFFFISILILSGIYLSGQDTTIEDLWTLYGSHDYKSVINMAKPLLANDPDNIDLNLVIGRSFTDMAEYEHAVPYLKITAEHDMQNSWQKAWALDYLGTCYFMLQEYDSSEKSLNACIKLNATKNATNDASGRSILFGSDAFYKNWKIVDSDHFHFHFQNMSDDEIKRYISLRETAYQKINEFFRSTLPKKIDFYVWQSREDAKKILHANLGFSRPAYCIVHTHYQQTIGHEMTHVISNYTSEISVKTRFINEGTAVCFDQTTRDRLQQVKESIASADIQISIAGCWENGNLYPDDILYPLSGLFVEGLIDKFGREKFLEFFSDQTYDHARDVYGKKLDKFIREFEIKINA